MIRGVTYRPARCPAPQPAAAPCPLCLARHARAPAPACTPNTPSRARAQPAATPSPAPSPMLNGQWPSRFCTQKIFFFLFFFFISFSHWKITKNIFIYFISFSSTPINFLKFISSIYIYIYIFSTNQINCLNLFYLFSCSSLHIVNSKVCFPTCLCAIYLSTQLFTSHIQHDIHTKQIHTTIHQST